MKISKVLMLAERTMGSLISVTAANFGGGRQQRANTVQIRNIEYTPSMQQGMLQIASETFSSPSQSAYDTKIMLQGVEYIDESKYNFLKTEVPNDAKYNIFQFTGSDGSEYYVRYERAKSLDVKVGCTCEDFRWRFASYNASDNSLLGNPPPTYTRTTDRGPVNPSKTPGVCKHLKKLKKELETEEFFRILLK